MAELRPDCRRARAEELPARDRLRRFVVAVTAEVHHVMRVVAIRTGTD
jgi:hypothetical protein